MNGLTSPLRLVHPITRTLSLVNLYLIICCSGLSIIIGLFINQLVNWMNAPFKTIGKSVPDAQIENALSPIECCRAAINKNGQPDTRLRLAQPQPVTKQVLSLSGVINENK
ncbi:TPA: hypothetical protein O7142_002656 [Salmonella enterica]|nr:hypothetical protein [Salmonella enterica]